jgi:gliding motility-associated-like protein
MKKLYVLLIFFSLLVCADAVAQTIRYVKVGGTGSGASWATASGDLQAMINAAATGDEIWVAAGTYKPNRRADATSTITATDRYNAFVMKKDVAIYGGFAGTETSRFQRNVTSNLTILSGNIGDEAIDTDNAYHVVVASGDLGTAKLDGFTITKGYTSGTGTGNSVTVNGNAIPPSRSPGIINYYSSAAYENLIIRDNFNASTDQSAGAIYIFYGSPTYTKVKFINNKVTGGSGGAVFIFSAVATPSIPIFNEVDFTGNEANSGGGIAVSTAGAPVFNKCNFEGNKSLSTTAGAVLMNSSSASASFNECTFSNNTALTNGGGISNALGTTVNVTNCTFSNNTAGGSGGGIYFTTGTLNLTGSTFSANKANSAAGVYLGTSTLASTITEVSFLNNEASTTAGALYLNANSPQMRNVKFIGNKAATSGGAIYLFGVTGNLASPVLINNLFYNNESNTNAGGGAGIYVSTSAAPIIHNATFFANKAVYRGGAIYVSSTGSATVYNSISYKNTAGETASGDFYTATAANLVVKATLTEFYGINGTDGNLVGQDPVFESEDPNNAKFLYLQDFSPAIDAGQKSFLPSGVSVDLAGKVRINNLILDMGAFEFGGAAPVPPLQVSIDENLANGSFVAKPVTTLTGVITNWTIVSGNFNDAFAINSTTGNITVAKSAELDYEKVKSFTLTIKVFNNVGGDQVLRVIISLNNLMEDPQAPVIANVKNGVLTSFRPRLSGIAEPLSVITIYVDDKAHNVTAFSNDKGDWVYNFTDELSAGAHTFYVIANNSLGTSNASPKTGVVLRLYSGEIVASNILTPNGDGKNDFWTVTDLQVMYPKNEVIVYDKVGKVVFKKANYQNDWDGSFNGATLNAGTYYYEINIGAGLKPVKGTITILKGR